MSWLEVVFLEPGSPWETGYVESFNRKLRDELLAREAFDTLLKSKGLIERWRQHYKHDPAEESLGITAPGPGGAAALCGCYGCASATAKGWSVGG